MILRAVEDVYDPDEKFPLGARYTIRDDDRERVFSFCDVDSYSTLACGISTPDNVSFVAHKCCWKAINHPTLITSSQLLDLAQCTRTIPPSLNPGGHDRTLSQQTHLGGFDPGTSLGKFLRRVTWLPVELQAVVLDHLGGSLFASLLKTRTAAKALLHRLGPSIPVEPTSIGAGIDGIPTSICVRTSLILGQPYLTSICLNKTEGTWLPLPGAGVRGLQYALGEYGLRAVRILYQGGSCSTWLGDPSSSWFGTVMGSDLKELNALADVRPISYS